MARYELSEGSSNKFWEIEVEGTTVTTRWGRIGTAGQAKTKDLKTVAAAHKERDKLIAEKTGKGYQRVEAPGEDAAPAAPSASNPELEAAILADPDDAHAYLVYADWLQAQGDPRGELITLQHAAATRPDDAALARAADDHLRAHASSLLGPLARFERVLDGRDQEAFTWRNGFIRAARLSVSEHEDHGFESGTAELYEALIRHPSGRLLVELTVGMNRTSYDDDQQPLIDAMVRLPPPALRWLFIGDFEQEDSELSWYNIGDLGALWSAVPRLRHLVLRGGSWTLGELDLPEARRVELQTGGLSLDSGQAIVRARLPSAEHLEVWYGTDDYGGGCDASTVAALLARTDLPRLRTLGLKNADFADAICEVLPNSRLLPQLTHLDLSMGTMSDQGARAIAAHRAAFAHLEVLDVSDSYVSDEGLELLRGCARQIVAEGMRAGEEDDEDDRYVSVGE